MSSASKVRQSGRRHSAALEQACTAVPCSTKVKTIRSRHRTSPGLTPYVRVASHSHRESKVEQR
eukprot:2299785-Prymnesium_polylepis.1